MRPLERFGPRFRKRGLTGGLGGANTEPMKFVSKINKEALPPGISAAYFEFIQSFWKYGKLDPQIKEMIRMRSAMLADCKQ